MMPGSLQWNSSSDYATFTGRLYGETEVLGPVEAPIPRVKGRHRIHILLKTHIITQVLPLVRYAVGKYRKGSETIAVDVDPVDLM